jgi:hypothetical protein
MSPAGDVGYFIVAQWFNESTNSLAIPNGVVCHSLNFASHIDRDQDHHIVTFSLGQQCIATEKMLLSQISLLAFAAAVAAQLANLPSCAVCDRAWLLISDDMMSNV